MSHLSYIRKPVNKLQAVVFDVDGTLADTEEVHRLAFNHVFGEYGLDWNWTPALYRDLLTISGGRERITRYGAGLRSRFRDEAAFEDFVVAMHRAKTRKYAAMLTEGEVRLRPGIRRLIDEIREAGVQLAIATSSALSNAETLLDNNLPPGWRAWFSAIETCDSVTEKKPSPAVYNAVVARLGLGTDALVALEDTPNGLRAATAAGIATVVTTHPFTRDEPFEDAELVVDSAGEPDAPFTVERGDAGGRRYLDCGLLDEILCRRASRPDQRRVARAAG